MPPPLTCDPMMELTEFPSLHVRVNPELASDEREELWNLYSEAFRRIAHHNPCRQYLRRDEFERAVRDPEFTVILGFDAGVPVFFCMCTEDFSLLPWIAPEFYDAHFPQAKGKRCYVAGIFIRVDKQGSGYARPLMLSLQRYMEERGLMFAFFDHGGDGPVRALPAMIAATPRTEVTTIGTQLYQLVQTFPEQDSPLGK